LIPFGATFLMFSEYARNALRMAALMKVQSIFVYTHDSIGLGEDGPTHQPIEQIPTLRMIPNMAVWRPCDAVESAVSWQQAMERKDGPSCLIFSRQGLPHQTRTDEQIANITKGGYILGDCGCDNPDAIIIATGSEVALAMDAAAQLSDKKIRVVSMPSVDAFEAQDDTYKASVLKQGVPTLAVEAAVTQGWYKYADKVIGIDRFGESAPAGELFKEFGFTVENVVSAVESIL
jgi:transketolase